MAGTSSSLSCSRPVLRLIARSRSGGTTMPAESVTAGKTAHPGEVVALGVVPPPGPEQPADIVVDAGTT